VLASGKSISTSTVQNLLDSSINNSFASTTALVNTLTNSINSSIDSTVNRILSERDITPATSTVNQVIDRMFVYAFNNSTSSERISDLLNTSFAATGTEGVVEKFSFVDMQFFVLKNIDELNKKVDMFNEGVLTIASIVTDKLTAKEVQTDKLCIGQTCITETELQDFLRERNATPYTTVISTTTATSILPTIESSTTSTTTIITETSTSSISTTTFPTTSSDSSSTTTSPLSPVEVASSTNPI
jgi:hypothetical protein